MSVYFCFPQGKTKALTMSYDDANYQDRQLVSLFNKYGIKSNPSFELPHNPMVWHPTCHHSDPKLMEYGKFFVDFSRNQYLKLMYVWGHSFC